VNGVNAPTFAATHTGMRVDYQGLLRQARSGLSREPALAEMLRQLTDHITELGRRFYAGDSAAVDEFLQLYCVERDGRLAASAEPRPSHEELEALVIDYGQTVSNKDRLHVMSLGKVMSDETYITFTKLRDEIEPTLRKRLVALLASQGRQP
jgi:hypothetical protein